MATLYLLSKLSVLGRLDASLILTFQFQCCAIVITIIITKYIFLSIK